MARYQFKERSWYAGRLLSVRRRPLENRDPRLALIRLEFEIFAINDEQRTLKSDGEVACRDLVLWPAPDEGLIAFANALKIRHPSRPAAWQSAERSQPWVKIQFGAADPEDERNPFQAIIPFSPSGYRVLEFDLRLSDRWVTPKVAAEELDVSRDTIRRIVERNEPQWGHRLVRRTKGNQRRINLLLLVHLHGPQPLRQQLALPERNRLHALERENAKLNSMIKARDEQLRVLQAQRTE